MGPPLKAILANHYGCSVAVSGVTLSACVKVDKRQEILNCRKVVRVMSNHRTYLRGQKVKVIMRPRQFSSPDGVDVYHYVTVDH